MNVKGDGNWDKSGRGEGEGRAASHLSLSSRHHSTRPTQSDAPAALHYIRHFTEVHFTTKVSTHSLSNQMRGVNDLKCIYREIRSARLDPGPRSVELFCRTPEKASVSFIASGQSLNYKHETNESLWKPHSLHYLVASEYKNALLLQNHFCWVSLTLLKYDDPDKHYGRARH